MNKMPRARKLAMRRADANRRSSRTDAAEDVRILLSTTRFRAHDTESTPGCLGASTRHGTSALGSLDETGRE